MGSIAAHNGEEEGKMKRSTGRRNLDSGEEGAQGKKWTKHIVPLLSGWK
jgi:hypothetical protein